MIAQFSPSSAGTPACEMDAPWVEMPDRPRWVIEGTQHATGSGKMTTANTHILETSESDQSNRFMQILLIAAIAASGISMLFSIGTAFASASDQAPASVSADQ
jgi:hypothetical protein